MSRNEIERDFKRDIWCIFGLPFDNSSMEAVSEFARDCIKTKCQGVWLTPNLEFVAESLKDLNLKKVMMCNEISTIDGSPVLWAAYLLGLPFKRRVTGVDLVRHIVSEEKDKNYRIYFFGGHDDVAKKAFLHVNFLESVIKSTGYKNPGFGSIEEMSREDIIRDINQSGANTLFIALGLNKSCFWIDKNRDSITADFIAHVGSAIAFITGSVKLAPRWMRIIGAESLWKGILDFTLWRKKYLEHTVLLIRLFTIRMAVHILFLFKYKRMGRVKEAPVVDIAENGSLVTIKIRGACNRFNNSSVRNCFKEAASKAKDVIIDLSGSEYVDNSFLGLLLLLFKYQQIHKKSLNLTGLSPGLKKIFKLNLLDDLFGQ